MPGQYLRLCEACDRLGLVIELDPCHGGGEPFRLTVRSDSGKPVVWFDCLLTDLDVAAKMALDVMEGAA